MNIEANDASVRDCLVAVVNNDLDLHRFARERWYRIPQRALGHSVASASLAETNVLALYQTASISSGLPRAIELWGEVDERITAPRRALIPDEPNHPAADEEYHVLRLKNVERLAMPIISRRARRITFLRTTRDHLFRATDINELIVGTPAEEKLWRALRDDEAIDDIERRYYMRMGGVVMEVDFALFNAERGLGVHCREPDASDAGNTEAPAAWGLLRFSPAQIDTGFSDCLRRIALMMKRMRLER